MFKCKVAFLSEKCVSTDQFLVNLVCVLLCNSLFSISIDSFLILNLEQDTKLIKRTHNANQFHSISCYSIYTFPCGSNFLLVDHVFWGTSISLFQSLKKTNAGLKGHQQVTDSYLQGLAVHNKGFLATLDKRLGATTDSRFSKYMEVVET